MHFKINLTLVSVLLIVLYFNIPFYNNWLNTNLLNPAFDIFALSKQMDPEQRKVNRFGYSYMVYREMAGVLSKAGLDKPIVLLPPDAYLKQHGVRDFNVCEPAIFYYLTGLKSVWHTSPGVDSANCVVVPDGKGKVVLKKIAARQELDSLLTVFRKYKID